MNQPIALIQELTVIADLKRIVKYHQASSIFLNEKTANTYTSTFEIKLLMEEVNGELVLMESYHYADIVNRTLPDPTHEMTLLAMVKNMVDIEWGYYKSYHLTDEDGKLVNNLHKEIMYILKELKVLKSINADNSLKREITVKQRHSKIISEKPKWYDVPNQSVFTTNPEESYEIVELMINNRIKELSKSDYLFYPLFDEEMEGWRIEQIDRAIERMKEPFRDYRALWLFGKLVSETLLKYLKGEMDWQQGDTEITEKQGVIIYTILLLFHLIEPKEELKFKDDRGKAKYIRSFFRRDTVNLNERFFSFEIDNQN